VDLVSDYSRIKPNNMNPRFLIYILIAIFCIPGLSFAQSYQNAKQHQCLRCHSSQTFSFLNTVKGIEEKRLMNPYYILDTIAMTIGVHKQFDCTDCHSSEYSNYPHNGNLKLEPLSSCLDCHGGDESYAKYHFERIDTEFKKSVHYKVYGENFTCSKCHSQHSYQAVSRNSDNIPEIVEYSNKMCLSCHNEMSKYELIANHKSPKLVQVHSWLPNQELHFEHVRCIECHTEVLDSLSVSHNILPKSKAVHNCVECHSGNSRLKASLYKYQKLQKRSENGIMHFVLGDESYIIGSHQVPELQIASIVIFLLSLAGIIIHLSFRIIKKK
jgi:hypothetical protein